MEQENREPKAAKGDSSKQNSRERILASAMRLFADNGFRATSTRTICEDAGVNHALVRYYFGDKEKLYREVALTLYKGFKDDIIPPDFSKIDTKVKWEAAFERFYTGLAKKMASRTPPSSYIPKVYRNERIDQSPVSGELQMSVLKPLLDALRRLLKMRIPSERIIEVDSWVAYVWSNLTFLAIIDPAWEVMIVPPGYSRDDWLSHQMDWRLQCLFKLLGNDFYPEKTR